MLEEREISAFEQISGLMKGGHGRWWIIGRAALELYGVDTGGLKVIDVIVSPGEARRLADTIPTTKHRRQGTPLIRARSTLSAELGGMPVEFHSWMEIRVGGEWRPFALESRVPIEVGEVLMPVPARDELAAMLAQYGTGKDRTLAAQLTAG